MIVKMSATEVEAFARQWPGSGLEDAGGMYFEYDSRGGLVDYGSTNKQKYKVVERADELALVGLSENAQAKGKKQAGPKPQYKGIVRVVNPRTRKTQERTRVFKKVSDRERWIESLKRKGTLQDVLLRAEVETPHDKFLNLKPPPKGKAKGYKSKPLSQESLNRGTR